MAVLSREEVCAGAERWFAKYRGKEWVDGDVGRVYFGVCKDAQTLEEVLESWSAGRVDPLTLEQAEDAWQKLVGMAEQMKDV